MVFSRSTIRSGLHQKWIPLLNMASGNPICISSSPPSARQPTSTPATTTANAHHSNVSSSSALPSPSTFFPARQPESVYQDQRPINSPSSIGLDSTIAPAPKRHGRTEDTYDASVQSLAKSLAVPELPTTGSPPKKKRRAKKRPKSDSFILNSDEGGSIAPENATSVVPPPGEHLTQGAPIGCKEAWAGWASALEDQRIEPSLASNYFTLQEAQQVSVQAIEARSTQSVAAAEDDADAPVIPLTELLSNFGYVDKTPLEQSAPALTSTKRRRIELVDPSAVSDVTRKPRKKVGGQATPAPKPIKKARSPKKKAQTITALAMAPYQIVERPVLEPSAVPRILASDIALANKPEVLAAEALKRAQKPRNPRAKPADGTDTGMKAKKATTSKKPKSKSNEADPALRLYSPKRACEQIGQQDFLFGTSSQLMVDESPAFIVDMQSAMAESETLISESQLNPQSHVATGVSRASSSTILAMARARRALWSSASRDINGGILRDDSGLAKSRVKAKRTLAPSTSATAKPSDTQLLISSTKAGRSPQCDADSNEAKDAASEVQARSPLPHSADEDSWALLSSSSPAIPEVPAAPAEPPSVVLSLTPNQTSCYAPTESNSRIIAGPPSPHRKALGVRDANISIPKEAGQEKCVQMPEAAQKPQDVTTASSPATGRPVGRPRKNASVRDCSAPGTLPSVQRKRGRPPKIRSTVLDQPLLPQVQQVTDSELVLPTSKLQISQSPKNNSWVNIDEITDDEIPNTPSPRRRLDQFPYQCRASPDEPVHIARNTEKG
nr:structure-specific endonuclease subunit slx4 [Quercus suber]